MDSKKPLILFFLVILFLLIGVSFYFSSSKSTPDITKFLPEGKNLTTEISKKLPSIPSDKDSLGITKISMSDGSTMYRVQGHFTEKLSEKFSFLSAKFLITGTSNNKEIPVFLVGNSGKMNFGRVNGRNNEETIWTLTSGKEISEAIQPKSLVELTFVIRSTDVDSQNRQKMIEKIISERAVDPDTALTPEMIRIL